MIVEPFDAMPLLICVAVAAETTWGSDQGSAGVGVVLGEAWIDAALQQRWRLPAQLNLQLGVVATRWRHTSGCHIDAGPIQSVHVGSGTSNEPLDCISTLLLSFKSISANGFRVRKLVLCVTRRWQHGVGCIAVRTRPFTCRKLCSCWARWYYTLFSNRNKKIMIFFFFFNLWIIQVYTTWLAPLKVKLAQDCLFARHGVFSVTFVKAISQFNHYTSYPHWWIFYICLYLDNDLFFTPPKRFFYIVSNI